MKKIKTLILLVGMMLNASSVSAEDYACEGTYWEYSNNCCLVKIPSKTFKYRSVVFTFTNKDYPIRMSCAKKEVKSDGIISLTRGEYRCSISGEGKHGAWGKIKESLVYSVNGESWKPVMTDPLYETSWNLVEGAYHHEQVDLKSINVPVSGLVDDKDFEGKDYCTVQLKVVVNVQAITRSDDCEDPQKNICTETISVKVYKCDGGQIQGGEGYTSTQSADSDIHNIYAVDDGNGLEILNKESPTIYKYEPQTWIWYVSNVSQQASCDVSEVRSSETPQYNYGKNISYDELINTCSDLNLGNENGRGLKPGAEFYVKRVNYVNENINCSSNNLHFKVYPEVFLSGFDHQKDTVICEQIGKTQSSDQCFRVEGRKVSVPSGFDSNVYGLSYRWEYKVGNQGWRELPMATDGGLQSFSDGELTNYSESYGYDPSQLYLKKEELKRGILYKFRQKVVLTSFGNRELYASNGFGEIRVRVYENIKQSDFIMADFPKVCQNAMVDTAVNIQFNPSNADKSIYSIRDFENNRSGFRYSMSAVGLLEGELSEVANAEDYRFRLNGSVADNVVIRVRVTDGCGTNVDLGDTMWMKKKPVFPPSMIVGLNCSVTTANDRVYIAVAQGQSSAIVSINGTDEDFDRSRYYISLGKNSDNGEIIYDDWILMNKSAGYAIQPSVYSYIKIKKETNGCESDEVDCLIQNCESWINQIGVGNLMEMEYRICKDEGNPAIRNSQLRGAYGEESYSYNWKYSKDGVVWTIIEGQTEKNLPENVINPASDTFYVLREVTSTMGLTQISNASNRVMIVKYHMPLIHLLVNGSDQRERKSCYGERVKVTVEEFLPDGAKSEGGDMRFNVCRRDANNRYKAIYDTWARELKDLPIELTENETLYGAVVMCGDTVYTEALNITVGRRLDEFKESIGACKVKGDSVLIVLPNTYGVSYSFTYGDKVYPPTVDSLYVRLPEVGNAYYAVTASDDECSVKVAREIIAEDMQERLTQHPLSLDEDLVDGKVCAGNSVTIKSVALDERQENMVFTWYENGNKLKGSSSLYSYVPQQPGMNNTVVRQTDYYVMGAVSKELCMTTYDTIQVQAIPPVKLGSSSVSGTSFCYGDTATLLIGKATGGGGKNLEYNIYKKNEEANVSNWVARVETFSVDQYQKKDAVFTSGMYSVTVQDQYCKNKLYSDSATIGVISVNKNEEFVLRPNKLYVEENELEDGRTVNIVLTSPEIESDPTSVNLAYNKNGASDTTVNYVKGSGFAVPVRESDFLDGVLRINATKGSASCKYTTFVEIFYSKGFAAQPVVKCEEGKNDNMVEECRGNEVHLYVDSLNMPMYNDGEMDLKRVKYQWYKMGNQSVVQLNGATGSEYVARVGDSAAYRCQIIYDAEGTGKNLKRVYSTTYAVKPIDVARIGSVYFGKAGEFSKYACAGSKNKVTIDSDVRANVMTTEMVWQSSTDGKTWSDLSDVGRSVIGATTASCQVSTDLWSDKEIKTVYFRLKVHNTECDETIYSENTIVLRIEDRPKMDLSKVRMDGNGVIEETLESLSFYTYRDGNFKYSWSYGNDENFETNELYTIKNSKGFTAGEDSIFIFKESENGCVSDTVSYHFNVYDVLSAEWVNKQYQPLCLESGGTELTIMSIKGGSESISDYHVEWQYRTSQMSSFDVIDERSNIPFKFQTTELMVTISNARTSIVFANLTDSFDVRAIISCDNYPGPNLVLPLQHVRMIPRLEQGWIDANEVTICYDEAFVFIEGEPAIGGSSSYLYQWQWSEDKENWTDVREQTGCVFRGRVEQSMYHLKNTTYFRRITRDKDCSSLVDTSKIKTVLVMPKVEVPSNVVNYYSAVLSGERVVLQPNYNEYDYVWSKVGELGVVDTTYGVENYGRFDSEPLYDQTSYRFRVRYQNTPYCESDWDTVTISVLQTSGVELYFDKHLSNESRYNIEGKYWICSGGEVGMIRASGSNGSVKHQWMYGVNGGDLQKMFYMDGSAANGEVVDADECQKIANAVKNTETTAPADKYVSFCRVDTFFAGNRSIVVPSDTIKVYIVPPLSLSADVWNLSDSIAGQLISGQRNYCMGEDPQSIVRNVSDRISDFWISNKVGPKLYDAQRSSDSLRIRWEYMNRKTPNEWNKAKEVGVTDYLGAGTFDLGDYVEDLNGTYQVRSTLSDGCSDVSSNLVNLYWSDVRVENQDVRVYAVIDDDMVISNGIEVGDSVILQCATNEYPCYWFLDEKCTDTIVAGSRACGFILNGNILKHLMSDPHIYLKRFDVLTGCMSSSTPIAIHFGTKSGGGKIGSSQTVCEGEKFRGITNRVGASGNYIYPSEEKMKFTYSWQYSTDVDMGVWVNISGNSNLDLFADKVDSIVGILHESVYWFRRIATNDSGRSSFSDTVRLAFYDKLKPGVVSLAASSAAFCESYDLPYVKTTKPQGGHTYNDDYDYSWQVSVNGGEYITVISTSLDSVNLAYLDLDSLNRAQNNNLRIRCVYSDFCGSVNSNEVDVLLYRTNESPRIYEDNKCGADTVVVRVESESTEKVYHWFAYDGDGSAIWDWKDVDYKKLYRIWETQNGIVQYSVHSVDAETGCSSMPIYFNIDSMPSLVQEQPTALNRVCYGEVATIIGGFVSGGSGNRSFQWQYSYDDNVWVNDQNGTLADYVTSKMTLPRRFRRIVMDDCYSDTSDVVAIIPMDKVEFHKEDLVFEDFKCPLHLIYMKCTDSVSSICTSADRWEFFHDGNLIQTSYWDKFSALEGFEGDSMTYQIRHVREIDGLFCQSDFVDVTLYNSPAVTANVITTEVLSPCEGRLTNVKSSAMELNYHGGKSRNEFLTTKWLTSKDGVTWGEQASKADGSLSLRANGTMYVTRIVNSGCVNDSSNILAIVARDVEPYDYVEQLSLNIVSDMRDSSVAFNVIDGKNFSNRYYFLGDGDLPKVEGNTVSLPYKTGVYKDSLLQLLVASDVCVSQYDVNPLRGGVISFDGETELCGGGEIPSIVATDMEGGRGNYTYQWQYANTYTTDFINIEGANGKLYTPTTVSVGTTYRRITTDGEYTSISNELMISIRSLPSVARITTNYSEQEMEARGLEYTLTSAQKNVDMIMFLRDSAFNVDRVLWQKSYDLNVWETVEEMDYNVRNFYEMEIVDTSAMVYYRIVGESPCGADTSKLFLVKTDYAPIITDDELVLTDTICVSDTFVRIAYKNPKSDKYRYSYSLSTNRYAEIYCANSSLENRVLTNRNTTLITQDSLVTDGIVVTYPKESFDVTITRHSVATGATSKKVVHFEVGRLSASFKYVVDGTAVYGMGEPTNSVRLNQGSEVTFLAEAKSDLKNVSDISYKWQLIRPLNFDYFALYGGNNGIEGLTSKSQSPSCYFYNAGTYKIRLEVTDGICKSTMSDSALYIDKSTVRSYKVAAAFADEDDVLENEAVAGPLYVDVTPTLVKTSFEVYTNTEEGLPYEVIDEVGLKVKEGILLKTEWIDATAWRIGVYIVNVNGMIFKVIKM